MKALATIIALVAVMFYCVSATRPAFYFQQVQQPANSTDNFVSVGCFCVKSNDTLGVTETLTNLLDCYCLADLPSAAENNGSQNLNLSQLVNPSMNLGDQAALVCTCAFPKSDADASNQSFLLPGYDGTGFVPVNCTCARAIDYVAALIPPTITIPILNITIPVPISNPNKPYENLLPMGCFCSSRLELFKDLNIVGYNPSIPALLCKCLPTTNVTEGNLLVYGSDLTVPAKEVDLNNLGLAWGGFDVTPIFNNITDSVPAGFVYPESNLTIPFLNISIRPPPYVNVIPPQAAIGPQARKSRIHLN